MSEEVPAGKKPARLICLSFDMSGTKIGQEQKANIRSLLDLLFIDATKSGSNLCFIMCRGRFAKQMFGFDASKEDALASFDESALGGTTPLASAIHLGVRTLKRGMEENPGSKGMFVFTTDGTANVPISLGTNIQRELEIQCRLLAGSKDIHKILVDISREGSVKADELATLTGSVYYHSRDLNANDLYNIIKFESR